MNPILSQQATSPSSERVSQVVEASQFLEHKIAELAGLIELLSSRLEGVLRVEPPQPETNPAKVEPARVPVADRIAKLGLDIQKISRAVNDLLLRLEL